MTTKNKGGAPMNNQNALKQGPTRERFLILRLSKAELRSLDRGASAKDLSRNSLIVRASLKVAERVLKRKTVSTTVTKEYQGRTIQIPLRVIPAEQALIDRAAAVNGESRNSFMINAALDSVKKARA